MAMDLAYEAEITLWFNYNKTQLINIEQARISYIMIEHKYESVNILPVIYLAVSLSSDMYTKVVTSYKKSSFLLKIKKRNALLSSSIQSTVVDDEFTYIPSSTNPNISAQINSNADSDGNSYRSITLGLVSQSMTNKLRQSFNGIYNNISENEIIDIGLKGIRKVIKEDIVNNEKYDTIIIPPLSSRYKLLNFLFDRDPFYDTGFTFYMDFKDTAYLISKNGKAVDAQDGKPTDVIIDVLEIDDPDSFKEGFQLKNKAYRIAINSSDTNVILNGATAKVANQIVAYEDDLKQAETLNLNMNNSDTATRKMFVRSNAGTVLKSELETNAFMIELLKKNIDSDIFTPNKAYKVNNISQYSEYNGNYILSYKREFYKLSEGTTGRFIVTCNVGLKRVSNPSNEYISNNGGIISKSGTTMRRTTSRKTTSENRINNRKKL